MKTDENYNWDDLLGRPLYTLSCREYIELMRHVVSQNGPTSHLVEVSQAIGMVALAKALGCSVSLLYGIKQKVDFEPAIISHIGRKPVFNVEIARKLADEYMTIARKERMRRI